MTSAQQLRHDLRALVIDRVSDHPEDKRTLAVSLAVPESSVDRTLTRATWDLDLALASADALGVRFRVVRG